jgi:hypothetical protein
LRRRRRRIWEVSQCETLENRMGEGTYGLKDAPVLWCEVAQCLAVEFHGELFALLFEGWLPLF